MGGASALGERRFGSLKADRTNWFSPKAPAVAMPKREESSSSRLTTALFDAICDLIFQSTSKTRRAIAGAPSAETKMKRAALTILGALLVAEMAVQMATASEHHIRSGRGHRRWRHIPSSVKRARLFKPPNARRQAFGQRDHVL
jgi:hypothetical protein